MMSELSKLFPDGFVRLPNWLSAEQKNFMLRAMSDYETLLSENQRLTAISTKHATRADELYEALEQARDFIANDKNAGPCGLGLICIIDDVLQKPTVSNSNDD